MISAKEAAEMYEKSMNEMIHEELKEVNEKIKRCIKECNGRYIYYGKELSYESVCYLQSLGYTVNNLSDQRDGDYYKIEF